MKEIIYNLEDVCQILHLHYQTVLKMLRSKELCGFKAGREWRITKTDLDNYIEKKKGE